MQASSSTIKSEIFRTISDNRISRNNLAKEFLLIKEKRDKKLDEYKELEPTAMIEVERKLTLEKANSILLQYQNRIKMCDLYAKRAQPFMNCVIAIEKNDEEEYKRCVEKFVEEVKEQALELKRMEIRESKQKRIVYNTTKQWLKILERTNYNEWKTSREKNEIQKNIEEENMRFFELGEEEEIIKIGLKSQEITMKREDFSDIQILNTSPLILITSICPNIKNDFSNLNEQRARKNK